MICTYDGNVCLRCLKVGSGLTRPQIYGLVGTAFRPGHVSHFVRRGGVLSLCGSVGRDGRRAGYFGARMSKGEVAEALSRSLDWKSIRQSRRAIPQDLWLKCGPGASL